MMLFCQGQVLFICVQEIVIIQRKTKHFILISNHIQDHYDSKHREGPFSMVHSMKLHNQPNGMTSMHDQQKKFKHGLDIQSRGDHMSGPPFPKHSQSSTTTYQLLLQGGGGGIKPLIMCTWVGASKVKCQLFPLCGVAPFIITWGGLQILLFCPGEN